MLYITLLTDWSLLTAYPHHLGALQGREIPQITARHFAPVSASASTGPAQAELVLQETEEPVM